MLLKTLGASHVLQHPTKSQMIHDPHTMSFNPDDPTIKLMRKLSTREGFIDEVYTRLPAEKTMVEAYWSVEYDHMSFFDRPRYSGHESFKTVLSKARRRKVSL